jgi:hypothetical protein
MMSDYTESEDRGDGGFGTRVGGGKVGFEPSEEFGSDAKAVAAATSTDSASSVGTFGDVYGGMGARAKELLRYVEFEKYPDFRQRGFYLGVIIDQQKVADFLVELSNAPWPIRIVRFQVGPNPRSTGPRMSPSRFGGPLAFGGMGGAGYLAGSDTAEYESSSIYQDYAGAGSYPESSAEYAPDDSAGLYPGAGSTYPGATYPGGGYPGAGAGPGGASDPLAKTLDHPDLVQLYVCGVITFYNPPAEEAAPASAEPPTEQVVPTETISETPTETPADAGTPAEGATAPASDTPADPAAPTQPAAPVDPPAAPTDAAPPTPPATGDRPAPNATEPGAGSATGT